MLSPLELEYYLRGVPPLPSAQRKAIRDTPYAVHLIDRLYRRRPAPIHIAWLERVEGLR